MTNSPAFISQETALELLEACKAALPFLKGIREEYQMAQKAIEKAEGRS